MNGLFNPLLYVVTDRDRLNGVRLEEQVEAALRGGATMVQLREKSLTTREFLNVAIGVKKITDRYNIPLIINDRLDIALAVDAAGLHVGAADLPAKIAERLLGAGKVLGVSVTDRGEAFRAEAAGADYLGVGAIFFTSTKSDAKFVSIGELAAIIRTVKIPVVAIGGINETNVLELTGIGLSGIAAAAAIFGEADVKKAAALMKKKALKIIGNK